MVSSIVLDSASQRAGPRMDDRPAIERESDAAHRRVWQAAVRRLAAQINVGWWLSLAVPLVSAVGLLGLVAVLFARWRWPASLPLVSGGIAVGLVAAGMAAWWRTRRRFESETTARVRLEHALALDARLSAAAAGIGPWPLPPADLASRWPVTWRWRRPTGMIAATAGLFALAWWVPIAGVASARRHVIETPTDVRIVERWLEQLTAERLVDDRAVEEVSRKIGEILERPARRWYEHASLEAAGMLKEQTAAEMRELAGNLARAEATAATLDTLGRSLSPTLRDALARECGEALAALDRGGLKPAGELADLLDGLRAVDLAQLSADDRGALARRLATNRRALQQALARCEGFELGSLEGWCEACENGAACEACPECRDGKPCTKACAVCGRAAGGRPGRGGVSRGRGDASLSFGPESEAGGTRPERIDQPLDIARAAPDEVLAVVDGEHEVDEQAFSGPRAGGTVATPGDGGSAVRMDMLLPAEQAAVRRFFQEPRN